MESETLLLECVICTKRLPTDCFTYLPRRVCADCKAAEIASKQNEKMQAQAQQLMNQVLDANFIPTPGSPQLVEIMGEIYKCFGGPRNFARRVWEQLEAIMERRPATASSGMLLLQFMKLQMAIEENVQKQNTADMTDDQLRREQDIGLMKMMLDAAADPKRRQMLDKLMAMQGIKLTEITPKEILSDSRSETDEGAGSGD